MQLLHLICPIGASTQRQPLGASGSWGANNVLTTILPSVVLVFIYFYLILRIMYVHNVDTYIVRIWLRKGKISGPE